MDENPQVWLIDSVRYFRELGFFALFSDLSDEQLADQVRAAAGSVPAWELPEEDDPFPADEEESDDPNAELFRWLNRPRPDRKDLTLLSLDASRLWWEDGERDIAPGYEEYTRVFTEWSRISRGAFLPTDIREVWDKPDQWPDCKVEVAFSLNGLPRVLRPWNGYGWLDFGLLNDINALIAPCGCQFEMWDTGDQTTCLVVLTAEEKERLRTERGWQFQEIAAWAS